MKKNPSDKQEISPKQTEEEWRKVIEIHKFSDRELKKQSNFPITLTPSTAKLQYIANVISVELFSGDEVVLLDNENYQIPDSSTTQVFISKSMYEMVAIFHA